MGLAVGALLGAAAFHTSGKLGRTAEAVKEEAVTVDYSSYSASRENGSTALVPVRVRTLPSQRRRTNAFF